jgi:excisionase family DNA binding protein
MKKPATKRDLIYDQTVSITEAARRLHATRTDVRHLLATRQMSFVQVRGQLRIPTRELTAFRRKKSDD